MLFRSQFAFQVFRRLRLPDFGRRPNLLDKLCLVGDGISAGGPDCFQNERPQCLGGDVVIAANSRPSLPCEFNAVVVMEDTGEKFIKFHLEFPNKKQ